MLAKTAATLHTVSAFFYRPALGILLIRAAAGLIYMHYGWMKVENQAGNIDLIQSIGLPVVMAYAVTVVELLGGAMLALGILTRVAGVATGIAMIVAVAMVTLPNGGIVASEFEILLGAVSFGIALFGAGPYRLWDPFDPGARYKAAPTPFE